MEVAQLWRYPVMSMAGERIASAEVGDRGVVGDRRLAVFELAPNPKPKPLSGRDVPGLLRFRASLDSGAVQVKGPELDPAAWDSEVVERSLGLVCRRQLELRPVEAGAFDDSPILLVFLATVARLSEELGANVDPRRFRANLYLDGPGADPHLEPELIGREIRCGRSLALQVTQPCPRCSITTRDPDTWANWPQLLRQVVQAHDEIVGVYCRVLAPGSVAEGDPIELV
ncbi:MAG TPA: MOSC domain-containing protein [Candidatus Dormibacteraeota bacterium]